MPSIPHDDLHPFQHNRVTRLAAEEDADEEAQLLPIEELDFEDYVPEQSRPNTHRPRACAWFSGPIPPRVLSISPLFPAIQDAPRRAVSRLLPGNKHRGAALIAVLSIWIILFGFFLSSQLPVEDDLGQYVVNLDCADTLWRPKNGCGLDGIDCRPFDHDTFSFRCPAKCSSVQVLNAHPVGPKEIVYRPFIIGDKVYRGDSFLCGSAIHANVINDARGGCGKISRRGQHDRFASSKSNGLESISFDSYFPLSFEIDNLGTACPTDPRQYILFISLFFTIVISTFTTSPVHFFSIFTMIFAHVSFVSDPPGASRRSISVLPDHVSMFAKRLLPAMFCAVVLYWTVVRRTLMGIDAPVEKTMLWLGGLWFGALSNYTFDWIPISRLTAHDLEQQPGAKLALAIILIILVCIVAQQVYCFWLEGRLPRYLALYGLFILGIVICLIIPGVQLRIHHYILALLLLPGTSMQTRSSLLYQGVLLGLFINGIARWDFDSVIQTADALRGDGTFDSVIPIIKDPSTIADASSNTITVFWEPPPSTMTGISILVNDVERFRTFFSDSAVSAFNWTRGSDFELPEYLRFAFIRDGRTLDYTKAGTWFPNGTWNMAT